MDYKKNKMKKNTIKKVKVKLTRDEIQDKLMEFFNRVEVSMEIKKAATWILKIQR